MFGLERDLDSDLMRAWQMAGELSEQLSHNQKVVQTLQAQANELKRQAIEHGSGTLLRRYNVDISKETFESELERTCAQVVIENQTLLHENRQLSQLLKEFEQTLDTVMTKFRSHAHAAQQHEITLTRHYETLLLSREANAVSSDLSANTNVTASLQKLAYYVRLLLRSLDGEDTPPVDQPENSIQAAPAEGSPDNTESIAIADSSMTRTDATTSSSPTPYPRADWAHERELEIARLASENAHLRRVLAIDADTAHAHGIRDEDLEDRPPTVIIHPVHHAHHAQRRSSSLSADGWERGGSPPPSMGVFGAPSGHGGSVQGGGLGGGGGGGGGGGMLGGGSAGNGSGETIPLQRTVELQPGMRAGTVRRPSMIGRGRGVSIWVQPSPQQ